MTFRIANYLCAFEILSMFFVLFIYFLNVILRHRESGSKPFTGFARTAMLKMNGSFTKFDARQNFKMLCHLLFTDCFVEHAQTEDDLFCKMCRAG